MDHMTCPANKTAPSRSSAARTTVRAGELRCDDRHLLDFKTAIPATLTGPRTASSFVTCTARARAKHTFTLSGVFILKMPARLITPGKSLKLALRMKSPGSGWVMVHGYQDPFQATCTAIPPEPPMDAIAAFTPHVSGKQGVTIGEFDVPLPRK